MFTVLGVFLVCHVLLTKAVCPTSPPTTGTMGNCSNKICVCYGGGTSDCSGKELTDISDIVDQTTILLLHHNNLTKIAANALEGWTELKTLNLSHNSISELRFDSFTGLVNLVKLDVSYNQISGEIRPGRGVGNLTSLTTLDLSHNRITSITKSLLENLRAENLRELYINNNEISLVEWEYFLNPINLQTLVVHSNRINNAINFLRPLESLRVLDVRYNDFEVFDARIFFYLYDLNIIHFGQKQLVFQGYFDPYHPISERRMMQIENYNLETFPTDFFNYLQYEQLELINFAKLKNLTLQSYQKKVHLTNMTALDEIEFNKTSTLFQDLKIEDCPRLLFNMTFLNRAVGLQSLQLSKMTVQDAAVENHALKRMTNLTILSLEEIGLSAFKSKTFFANTSLLKLTELNLSKNRLEFLDVDAFVNFPRLQTINLSQNDLSSFGLDILASTNGLHFLDLSQNRIETLKTQSGILGTLRYLNLANNKIHQLGNVLHSLTLLETLDISNNEMSNLEFNVNVLSSVLVTATGNPWNCTCRFLEEYDILRKMMVVFSCTNDTKGLLTCHNPALLSGEDVETLTCEQIMQLNQTPPTQSTPPTPSTPPQQSLTFLIGVGAVVFFAVVAIIIFVRKSQIKFGFEKCFETTHQGSYDRSALSTNAAADIQTGGGQAEPTVGNEPSHPPLKRPLTKQNTTSKYEDTYMTFPEGQAIPENQQHPELKWEPGSYIEQGVVPGPGELKVNEDNYISLTADGPRTLPRSSLHVSGPAFPGLLSNAFNINKNDRTKQKDPKRQQNAENETEKLPVYQNVQTKEREGTVYMKPFN